MDADQKRLVRAFPRTGLGATALAVFMEILDAGGPAAINGSALARQMGLSGAAVTGALRQMEARGLIVRSGGCWTAQPDTARWLPGEPRGDLCRARQSRARPHPEPSQCHQANSQGYQAMPQGYQAISQGHQAIDEIARPSSEFARGAGLPPLAKSQGHQANSQGARPPLNNPPGEVSLDSLTNSRAGGPDGGKAPEPDAVPDWPPGVQAMVGPFIMDHFAKGVPDAGTRAQLAAELQESATSYSRIHFKAAILHVANAMAKGSKIHSPIGLIHTLALEWEKRQQIPVAAQLLLDAVEKEAKAKAGPHPASDPVHRAMVCQKGREYARDLAASEAMPEAEYWAQAIPKLEARLARNKVERAERLAREAAAEVRIREWQAQQIQFKRRQGVA